MSARAAAWPLAAALLSSLAWLSPRAIPYNMDEFVHYHALACATAPQERGLPPFRDGCGLYDLRLPFTSEPLPLRSYLYVGSLPVAPFYPFWLALRDPVAARVQGAVFAFVALFLAARLLGVRCSSVLLATLVFPVFLVTLVVDQGPVGISAVLFLGALLALTRGVAAGAPASRVAWGTAAGLLLFGGLWSKLVFAWWLPAAAAYALSLAFPAGSPPAVAARRTAPPLLAAALACVLPTAVLLAGVDRDGRRYLDTAVHAGGIELDPESVGSEAARLWVYAVDGARVAPRNLRLPSWPVDAAPLAAALAVGAAAVRGPRRRAAAAWTTLALGTFAAAAASAYSQWPHHFFFPLLLLVLALAVALDGLSPRGRAAVAVAIAFFWATLAVRWPAATFPTNSSFEKDELLRYVRTQGLDRDRFQVHTSWGTYYIAHLFGDPRRVSVFLKSLPDDRRQLAEVRELARGRGRPILLLSARRWERIQTDAVAEILGIPQRTWRFGDWWALEYDVAGGAIRSASRRP